MKKLQEGKLDIGIAHQIVERQRQHEPTLKQAIAPEAGAMSIIAAPFGRRARRTIVLTLCVRDSGNRLGQRNFSTTHYTISTILHTPVSLSKMLVTLQEGVPGDAVPWPGLAGCPRPSSPFFSARRRRVARGTRIVINAIGNERS